MTECKASEETKQSRVVQKLAALSMTCSHPTCPSPSYITAADIDSSTDDSFILLNTLPRRRSTRTKNYNENQPSTSGLCTNDNQNENPSYLTLLNGSAEPPEDAAQADASSLDAIVVDSDEEEPAEDEFDGEENEFSLSRWDNMDLTTIGDDEVDFGEKKFLANLFQPAKWKRVRIQPDIFENGARFIEDKIEEATGADDEFKSGLASDPEKDAMFYKLKKMRDVECLRMKEATNAIKAIKKKRVVEWSEMLLAQKILLETDQKYQVIVNKIRDLKYSDWRFNEPKHSATVTLSNFQYRLNQNKTRDKCTDFYVMVLSCETDVIVSEISRAGDGKLDFHEQFIMKNMDERFSIKGEVFTIPMQSSSSWMITDLLKKRSKSVSPLHRIYYENLNTMEVQESAVTRSSFSLCGTFFITKDQINNPSGYISRPTYDSRLDSTVNFTMQVDLTLASDLSGFLNLGTPDEDHNVVCWERKWCSLKGAELNMYNYPQEEEFEKAPLVAIDLEGCLDPLMRPRNVPKKFCFMFFAAKASGGEKDEGSGRDYDSEKVYLCADNKEDFQMWFDELDSVLTTLREWRKLSFASYY